MSYSNEGFFFICDTTGKITSVKYFYNNPSLFNLKGKMFVELFTHESITAALNFLTDVKKRTASFGWELNLKTEISELTPQYFSGIINEGVIYIFASPCQIDFKKFLEAMSLINTEQSNIIRNINKEHFNSQERCLNNNSFFDELSKVNNDLVNMQREISKANTKLKESIELNNYLLGMAAHDLRNPLGNISNYCDFLEETNCTEEQTEILKEIKYLSSFMLNLVSDLLNVSSIESGNIKLNKEYFDIILFLKNIIKRQRLIAIQKNIELEFDFHEEVLLNADKNKIEQVFTNLITNAIKFSNPNTLIIVSARDLEKSIVFEVKDQGQGISKEDLGLLFKPFQKASSKSTAGEPSTGLGLFIVKRIIEAGNGKIWVESELKKGTTFFVELMK